ncbi:MAG: hypothetical protein AB4058_12255, partial [Microcystaceae cyanobacterium]
MLIKRRILITLTKKEESTIDPSYELPTPHWLRLLSKDVALHDCYRVDRMALHHLYTAYQVFSGMSVVFPKRKLKQLW